MKPSFHPPGLIGFCLTAAFSVAQEWSLPEFCWSAWLAGLVFSWACVIIAGAQILLTARNNRSRYEKAIAVLGKVSPAVALSAIGLATLLIGWVALKLYSLLFGFYGLFLSVFAEMEPHSLFGRNGFINSDFVTPVTHLVMKFWPMALGTLIANAADLLKGDPWKRVLLPFQSEVLRIHLMVLALPFVTLLAWALFGAAYQRLTILLLTGLFFLLRKRKQDKGHNGEELQPAHAGNGVPAAHDRGEAPGVQTTLYSFSRRDRG